MAGCSLAPVYLGPDLRREAKLAPESDITYRLDAGRLNVPIAVARIEGQAVSYDEVAGSLWPERTTGTLRIVYPHPEAPAGYARAEVRVDAEPLPDLSHLNSVDQTQRKWYQRIPQRRPMQTEAAHETWVIDLPKTELDELISELSMPGRVSVLNSANADGAKLETAIRGHRFRGSCQPIAELDSVMRRVRSQGRLVAYSRPMTLHAAREQDRSAIAAYRTIRDAQYSGALNPYAEGETGRLALTSGLAAPSAEASTRVVLLPPVAH